MRRLFLFFLLLAAAGPDCRAEVGVGLGWPYAGVKYKFSRTALEAIGASDDEVSLFAGRFYWHFSRSGPLDLFTGVEGGRAIFDTVALRGKGYETAAFLGAEYYLSRYLSFSMDLAPTVVWLKSGRHEAGGLEWVLNAAVYVYIAPPKKKRSLNGPAPAEASRLPGLAQAPAERPKLAVATFMTEGLDETRGAMLANMFESELLKAGRWEITKRTDTPFVLAERALRAEDLSADATLAKLGRQLGVRRLVCGSVAQGEKESLLIRARVLDPETGAALGSGEAEAESVYVIMEAIKKVAAEILGN